MEEKNPTVSPRILMKLKSLFRLSDLKKSLKDVNMNSKLGFRQSISHKGCQKFQYTVYQ